MALILDLQAKQIQIDDLLSKMDGYSGDMERLREEKDAEIAILQEGMDSTIQQLSETQQVCSGFRRFDLYNLNISPQTQGIVDQATTAQIDTLILDNRKKLNQIIGELCNACLISASPAAYHVLFSRLHTSSLRSKG